LGRASGLFLRPASSHRIDRNNTVFGSLVAAFPNMGFLTLSSAVSWLA